MFKNDLVAEIAKNTNASKAKVEEFLNSFVAVVEKSLKKGEDVNLIGFGSFKVVNTKARTGRNPRTGKEIKIKAGKKVKFTVGKKLKDSVK